MPGQLASIVFDLIVVGILTGAVLSAWEWPFATRLFPLTIGIPVLTVALAQLLREVYLVVRGNIKEGKYREEHIHDIPVDRSVPTALMAARAGGFFGWAAGLFILVLLIGFKVAVPVFLIAFLKYYSRASWPLTIVLVASVLALLLGLFDQVLHVPWPKGVMERWLGL
ncbi:MAG: tripartite tricarboxylate transporter TctB family protein [Candidatus Binatia bacterium]